MPKRYRIFYFLTDMLPLTNRVRPFQCNQWVRLPHYRQLLGYHPDQVLVTFESKEPLRSTTVVIIQQLVGLGLESHNSVPSYSGKWLILEVA